MVVYFVYEGFIKCVHNTFKDNKPVQLLEIADEDRYTVSGGPICYSKRALKHSDKQCICEWSFECHNFGFNDMIGITSTLTDIKSIKWIFKTKGDCYFWWGDSGIWRRSNKHKSSQKSQDIVGWNKGDIITVSLDEKNWILIFLKNGKIVYDKIQLKDVDEKSEFYPFITLGNGKGKYYHSL